MSLLENCLNRLVKQGSISEKAAKDALGIAEGVQGRLYPSMGPTSSEAASALEAARLMAESARQRKLNAARQAIANNRNREAMAAHPKGKTHGLIAKLTRDIWESGDKTGQSQLHVEGLTEVAFGDLMRRAGTYFENLQSGFLGLKQDSDSIWQVVDELFGQDTGNDVAQTAAKGFTDMNKAAVDRLKRGGVMGASLDTWKLPQRWDSKRLNKFGSDEFHNDMMTAIETGGLKVRDQKDPSGYAPPAAISGIVRQNWKNQIAGKGGGTAGRTLQQFRVFEFQNAATYSKLMRKYGPGSGGMYGMMVDHAQSMAREIALAETFGPNYRAAFKRLSEEATQDYNLTKAGKSGLSKVPFHLQHSGIGASPAAAQRMFDYLSGELTAVESDSIAGIFGALRNIATSSRLGSAMISAVPGDTVTASLAANHNGIPAANVIARAVRDMAGGKDAKELASQMNLVSGALTDSAILSKRFEDGIEGSGVTAKLAQAVIRAQGLQAWTEAMKRAFSMEFLGLIGRQSDMAFDTVDKDFGKFLKRYGFSADDWDKLRSGTMMDVEGVRFFDAQGSEHRELADRLMGAVLDERGFAVIESNARVRQLTTGGAKRGTVTGEMARSATLFKSFAMTIMTTHLFRSMATGTAGEKVARSTAYLGLMTMAGAAAWQAKSVLAGKDPAKMDSGKFWTAAFIQGGGWGIYADLVFSANSRGELGVMEMAFGPVAQPPLSALVTASQFATTGKVNGRKLANIVKAYTPGSTLWFTRAATDRIIFDNIQQMIDPDWRSSMLRHEKRMRKEFDQGYFWPRGKAAPDRAPDLGNALGR